MPFGARSRVWMSTALVTAAYGILIWAANRFVTAPHFPQWGLSVTLAFTGVQFVLAAIILSGALVSRTLTLLLMRRGMKVAPEIQSCLAAHANGENRRKRLALFLRRYPEVVETSLFAFLSSLRGMERERLQKLAADLGLVASWTKRFRSGRVSKRRRALELLAVTGSPEAMGVFRRALDDRDEWLRVMASRALVAGGNVREVHRSFEFALRQTPAVRSLVAEDLKPHMQILAARALPQVLRSGDKSLVLAALDIIWGWGRAVPVAEVSGLIDSGDAIVRAVALRAAPYASTDDINGKIVSRISDEAPLVRRAAAVAAGKRRIEEAIPQLLARLQDSDERVAVAAARALATMGEPGLALLEKEVVMGAPDAASVALEALEKARIGRTDWE